MKIPISAETTSAQLFAEHQAGNPEAAAAIFHRYVERLLALARGRIGPRARRRMDADDVVQSAYRSFFVRAGKPEYRLKERGDLWRLLAAITLHKLYGKLEKETAGKRSNRRDAAGSAELAALAAREPDIVEVVAAAEQLSLIEKALSADERLVLAKSLAGCELQEIAKSLGKSQRTIRRLLSNVRKQFEMRFLPGRSRRRLRTDSQVASVRNSPAPLKFSDFRLLRLLGAGGMGKVYEAIDLRTGKHAAVKALHKSRQSDARAVTRFVQESRIVKELSHPNIVAVYGLGRFPSGGYFMVMDYIEGTDLQTRLAQGTYGPAMASRIVKVVANAVAHAHERGIVHCDLKPGNILIDKQERIFVTDFGFAMRLREKHRAALEGIGGTAGYLAPEVLEKGRRPTIKADIFALGAVLWTLVTGSPPRGTESLENAPTSLHGTAAICRRCLAQNPRKRFANIAEFLAAMDTLQ